MEYYDMNKNMDEVSLSGPIDFRKLHLNQLEIDNLTIAQAIQFIILSRRNDLNKQNENDKKLSICLSTYYNIGWIEAMYDLDESQSETIIISQHRKQLSEWNENLWSTQTQQPLQEPKMIIQYDYQIRQEQRETERENITMHQNETCDSLQLQQNIDSPILSLDDDDEKKQSQQVDLEFVCVDIL